MAESSESKVCDAKDRHGEPCVLTEKHLGPHQTKYGNQWVEQPGEKADGTKPNQLSAL